MADSAMVSAYFFAQKIEDFHPRFSGGVFKHLLFSFPSVMRFVGILSRTSKNGCRMKNGRYTHPICRT